MITAFEYETPIKDAIKARFISEVDDYENEAGETPYVNVSDKILFADYELADLESSSLEGYDGVVMSYFESSSYPSELSSSTTNTQGYNILNVTCVGFGDASTEDTFEDATNVKVATTRSQQLAVIAYKAIMDRQEIHLNFNDYRDEDIDSEKIIKDKSIQSAEKSAIVGATQNTRAISVYEYKYNIRLVDIAPTEQLGEIYAGSDIGIETEDATT